MSEQTYNGFHARVITDSVANKDFLGPPTLQRLTTFELTYPRCIHSELMTHRVFSRNASSSRAIPVARMIANVNDHPFIPEHWGQNEKGMQASGVLQASGIVTCRRAWLAARDEAVKQAQIMVEAGLHKQIANRILEPWMWITVIVTGSTFANWFKLRNHGAAEPHMQKLAGMMLQAYRSSKPTVLESGTCSWHLPFITEADKANGLGLGALIKKSVARCARGSYLQQEGDHSFAKDEELHDNLAASGHWSPFEHQACQATIAGNAWQGGNLGPGWFQYRKQFVMESGLNGQTA